MKKNHPRHIGIIPDGNRRWAKEHGMNSFPKELLPYTTRTPVNGGGIHVNFLVNYGWQWDFCPYNVCTPTSTWWTTIGPTIRRRILPKRWNGMLCRM